MEMWWIMIVEEHADCNPEEVSNRRHDSQDTLLRPQDHHPRRMRQFGKVDIPQEAFIAALKMED